MSLETYAVESHRAYHRPRMPDRAKLAASSPAMIRMLLKLEWSASEDFCQSCTASNVWVDTDQETESREHNAGCELDALLTSCGFPDQTSRDEARALLVKEQRR